MERARVPGIDEVNLNGVFFIDADHGWAVGSGGTILCYSPEGGTDPVFTDLQGYDWARDSIEFLASQGILKGVGEGRFEPGSIVTREQFAVLVERVFNLPQPPQPVSYSDLPANHWAYRSVQAASPYMPPLDTSTFGMGEPCTRETAASVLVRVLLSRGLQYSSSAEPERWLQSITDAESITPSLRPLIGTSLMLDIIKGKPDGRFDPQGVLDRAQAAVVLARALRNLTAYEETGAGLAGSPWPKPKGDVFNRMRTTAVGPAALTARITVIAGVPSVTVVGTDPPQLFFRPEEPVVGPRGDDVYIGTAGGLSTVWLDPAGWKPGFDLPGLTKSPTWASYKNQFYVALQAKTADGFAPNSTVYALPGDLSHAEQYEKYGRVVGLLEDNYRWKYEVEGIVNGALTVGSDHTLYVATSAGYLYAFHPDGEGRTGKLRWRVGPEVLADVRTSPALGPDGTIYVATAAGRLHAFSRAGEQKWAVEVAGPVHTSPAVAEDGTVYLGAADGRLHAFYPSGWEKWSVWLGEANLVGGPSIGHDGTVYVSAGDGRLYAVSPAGELLWSVALDSYLSSPVIGGDGTVYVGSLNGRLYALGPGGQVKWTLDPENLPPERVAAYGRLEVTQPAMGSAPVILADGKLLFRSGGYLFIVWP